MKKIAVEEHANEQEILDVNQRLHDMDAAGIDMQVISFSMVNIGYLTVSQVIAKAVYVNNLLAKVVNKYPDRLAAYAALAPQDPDASARELERAVRQLGLKGALIYFGQHGDYLDKAKYWPIFETAEKLDVPVYVHPGMLLPEMSKPYETYPILSLAMWGFGAGAGLQALRLICSGIFDKYPKLKIMLGHLGEGIPYFLWRIDKHYIEDQRYIGKDAPGNKLLKLPTQYFKENFFVTTSGMLWNPVLQFAMSVLGSDRILFAADYPPESALEAAKFIESAPINDSDKARICHLNAQKMFKV